MRTGITAPRRCLLSLALVLLATLLSLSAAPGLAQEQAPQIRLSGGEEEVQQNVRAFLTLAAKPCSTPRWLLDSSWRLAAQETAEALRAFGFYHPVITVSELLFAESCWSVSINIDPGDPVLLHDVDLAISGEASADPAFQKLTEKLPLKAKAPLRHAEYEAAKQAIASLAVERGYLHGEFLVQKLMVRPEEKRADITLHFNSGPRYHFGPVHLQQDILDPAFLDRFVAIRPQEPYLAESLADLHRGLADSQYFQSVEVRPEMEDVKDLEVPVEVLLTPRKAHSYSLGLGASTDTGPRLSAGYENRRLNRRGHKFAGTLSLSQVLSEFTSEYTIPLFRDPLQESLGFSAGLKRERTDTEETDIYQLGVMLNRKRYSWLESAFLDLSRTTSHIGDASVDATLLVPGILWTRTEADDPVRPRQGSRLRLKVQGAHDSLFSDASFLQLNTAAKYITTFPWKSRLLVRGEFATSLVDQFNEIPASYRFFAGGDASVRGYDYKTLGPQDAAGKVLGGRHLLVGSIEYEQAVAADWSVAVFCDSGNALDDFSVLSGQLKSSIGLGLRWHSPIGPLRLDLAHPLDEAGTGFRIHFSMGPDL